MLDLHENRICIRGNLQVIYLKGEYPVISGGDILIDPTRTRIVYKEEGHNLVVDDGRETLNRVMCGERDADPITYFCTGTGGYIGEPDPKVDPPSPTGADHDLRSQIYQTEITSKDHPNALATTFIITVPETDSVGDLSEFGLKTRSGKLFCRKTVRPRYKDNGVFLIARWTIQY